MTPAVEVHELRSGLFIWQRYDPRVKADLFSTGLTTSAGLYLLDPIAPEDKNLGGTLERHVVRGVIVTNENHARAAAAFAERFKVPVYAHAQARGAFDTGEVVDIPGGSDSPEGVTTIPIPGAPAGEIAVHCASDGGTLIVGDALINFGSHGFDFLPAKYCSDARLMRKSLPRLLEYGFERMLFAHGTPILTQARARLAQLLGGDSEARR